MTGGAAHAPVVDQVRQVLAHSQNHVILVDDARLFRGIGGYPRMDSLRQMVAALAPSNRVEVIDDAVRITPAIAVTQASRP
jgi:hypothetical protein